MNYRDIIEAAIPGARIVYLRDGEHITSIITGHPLDRHDQTLIPTGNPLDDTITFLIDTNSVVSITPQP